MNKFRFPNMIDGCKLLASNVLPTSQKQSRNKYLRQIDMNKIAAAGRKKKEFFEFPSILIIC